MLSELFGIADRAAALHLLIKNGINDKEELDTLRQLQNEASSQISKIWLHLGRDEDHVRQFTNMLRQWVFLPEEEFGGQVFARRQLEIFEAAQKIISEHQAKIGFSQSP
jgi:hypothetical protein